MRKIIAKNTNINRIVFDEKENIYKSKNNLYYAIFELDNIPNSDIELLSLLKLPPNKNLKRFNIENINDIENKQLLLEYIKDPRVNFDDVIFFEDLGYCLFLSPPDRIQKIINHDSNFVITEDKEIDLIKSIPYERNTSLDYKKKIEKVNDPINFLKVDNTPLSGENVNVAILDTGLSSHRDFKKRNIQRHSVIDNDANDYNGHGTHCCGIAFGNINKHTYKRYGIAYNSNIFSCKVLNKDGKGMKYHLECGIIWALLNDCKVINISIEYNFSREEKYDEALKRLLNTVRKMNCIVVAAAGNNSIRPFRPKPIAIPASFSSTLAISAINSSYEIESYSNQASIYHKQLMSFTCFGQLIYSSWIGDSYRTKSGTSMAAAFISGIVALLWEKYDNADDILIEMEKMSKYLNNKWEEIDVGKGIPTF